ncbi:GreA/GreB family elongation factor [Vibrio hangzhouensis]|uniref:GreA/GreB family elongation factor n=1 Tax=Vibrio hangzhouensis TaxID=462991 RepID=UPI001C981BC7|nr:GreA/GreB family elongation factor [Vibrio hangzhouensis]MBY6198895.1 GreA/GreB family elongation factor [Vibrio hangzhouensis]
MDKTVLLSAVIDELENKVATLVSAMEKTVDAATNEETVPEHKYDTLALEASYLAHGQAMRLEQVKSDIATLRKTVLRPFSRDDKVGLTALVQLEDDSEHIAWYFVLPCAGGVSIPGYGVTVVTPHSPLGKSLLGQSRDEEVSTTIAEKVCHYAIISIE